MLQVGTAAQRSGSPFPLLKLPDASVPKSSHIPMKQINAVIAFFSDNLGFILYIKIFADNLKLYLPLFIISSFLSSSLREMTT